MSIADKLNTIAENEQKVYDAGAKSEYDKFWDTYQDNGNRTDYQYGFSGGGWCYETLRPKYDMKPTRVDYMFSSIRAPINLTAHLEKIGITLDTSNCTGFSNFLRYMSVSTLPIIDTRSANSLATFSVNSSIGKIEKIILRDDGSQNVTNMFSSNHTNLTDVVFEGVIGTTLSMASCPVLSVESMKSIILHLKNYAGTDKEGTCRCVFTTTCWNALEADSTAPDGNTWKDYVGTLGWTL